MKDITANFGLSVITIKIVDQKEPGNNLVKIFASMILLKLKHVKKQAYL